MCRASQVGCRGLCIIIFKFQLYCWGAAFLPLLLFDISSLRRGTRKLGKVKWKLLLLLSRMRTAFPRIQHVVNGPLCGSGVGRDDLVLSCSDAEAFLCAPENGPRSTSYTLTLEEKVDGANLGIFMDPHSGELVCQNRAHAVNYESGSQWATINRFTEQHKAEILHLFSELAQAVASRACHPAFLEGPMRNADILQGMSEWVLYGEWMVAKHSIAYTRLPSPLLVFDIFHEPTNTFLCARDRSAFLAKCCPTLHSVRCIFSGPMAGPRATVRTWDDVHSLWYGKQSGFCDDAMEGAVIRVDEEVLPATEDECAAEVAEDRPLNLHGRLVRRAKAVHNSFTSGIEEHWTSKTMIKNIIRQ